MKNKKATQVGIILSFVIFITFLIFILVILDPSSNMKNSEKPLLETLKTNIKSFCSVEITSFILSLPSSADCYTLDESPYSLEGLNASARNQDKTVLNIYRASDILYIEKNVADTIYNVDYSPTNLNENSFSGPVGCEALNIESIKKTNEIVEPKIVELIYTQETNYDSLKQQFNLPSEKDFGIRFEFENKTIIGEPVPEQSKTTYVKKFQVIYLDMDANEKIGNFILYIF